MLEDEMRFEELLREDHHVHSTFSDGASTLEENVARCEALGLVRLGCVDHVRIDTTYVPEYAAAVRQMQTRTAVRLTVGVEAKILDRAGTLDLPPNGLEEIDRVYIADHQFPWDDGPKSPRVVREWIDQRVESVDHCIGMLVGATIASIDAYRRHPVVLAHLFSILPKIGLTEDVVSDALLEELATAAATRGAIVEISERWSCPSIRTMRAMKRANVEIVCSTDSHTAETIGRYDHVTTVLRALEA